MHPGQRSTLLPAEALCTFPQARDKAATAERMPGGGINFRLIQDAKLDRIESAGYRHLVHRRFQREHPGTLTGCTHDRGQRDIEPRQPVCGAAVR